ncbi:Uma2 family endonuclease [Zavarzinella formosa]|uniref:Uma2 family endonuclease n=1 Tax=Zavarzinella formosa TaxID=360055 RepID=UPI0002E00905|nr:Uma2 family endonuclease [Zavarzinella formosa]
MSAIAVPFPAPTPSPSLLTGEEYAEQYPDHRVELVRGIVRELPMPGTKHGMICGRISRLLGNFTDEHALGEIMTNDSFVRTSRNPDTVLGPDVAYYSYQRLPKGQVPDGISDVPPELVVEVRSPSDLWTDVFAKVVEYLNAGVLAVVIIDEDSRTISVCRPDGSQETIPQTGDLTIPEVLPGFSLPVARLFS